MRGITTVMIKRSGASFLVGVLFIVGFLSYFLMKQSNGEEVTTVEAKGFHVENSVSGKVTKAASLPSSLEKGYIICIDPGHQQRGNAEHEPVGPGATETKMKVTGGTTGVSTGEPEYELVLEASILLRDELQKRGYDVILTRETHEVNTSNSERAEIANQNKADLFIRVHADGSNDSTVSGFHILTPGEANPYTSPIFSESLAASQSILEKVSESQEIIVKGKGITQRSDLSGFNWAKVPTTLIEIGYMTNPEEDMKLSDKTYLTNMMIAIADGIDSYLTDGL